MAIYVVKFEVSIAESDFAYFHLAVIKMNELTGKLSQNRHCNCYFLITGCMLYIVDFLKKFIVLKSLFKFLNFLSSNNGNLQSVYSNFKNRDYD